MQKNQIGSWIILTIFITLIVVRCINEDAPWIGDITYLGFLISVENILVKLNIYGVLNNKGGPNKADYIYITGLTCAMVVVFVLIATCQIILTDREMDVITLVTLAFTILDNKIVKILRWGIIGGIMQVKKIKRRS